MVVFMLRELAELGKVTDTVYAVFIEPRHKALCDLWATATGRDSDDGDVILAILALIGQVLYLASRRVSFCGTCRGTMSASTRCVRSNRPSSPILTMLLKGNDYEPALHSSAGRIAF